MSSIACALEAFSSERLLVPTVSLRNRPGSPQIRGNGRRSSSPRITSRRPKSSALRSKPRKQSHNKQPQAIASNHKQPQAILPLLLIFCIFSDSLLVLYYRSDGDVTWPPHKLGVWRSHFQARTETEDPGSHTTNRTCCCDHILCVHSERLLVKYTRHFSA